VNETREGQWPFAVILSCIDSRTSAELIFDQGLGDVFSIRIAGNICNDDIIGSIEFACKVAGSKLIVVLGHTQCGAVKGACDHVELGNLTTLLNKIQPAVAIEVSKGKHTDCNSKNSGFVFDVTKTNVEETIKSIMNRSEIIRDMVESGQIGIVGSIHHLDSGIVEFIEQN
jgi:carbonic anhydrase